MKQFFVRLAFILVPICLLVCSINYFIDPANIFSSKNYQSDIAEILARGNNVDNISNYDERLLQEQLVIRLRKTPEIIVLGSSRIMEVGTDFFSNRNTLNCAVSHANIKDIIAITGLLDSMGRLPAQFLLNVDAGLICDGPSDEWKTLQSYYDYFLKHYSNFGTKDEQSNGLIIDKRFASIFSIEYFQASIDFIFKRKSKKITDAGKDRPLMGGRFADGTIAYNDAYASGDAKHISSVASETGKRLGVASVSEEQQKLLTLFLDFCEKKNISVKLCMIPYHPSFYAAVNTYHQQALIKYEQYFSNLAKSRNLQISGGFNPDEFQLQQAMFYDMYHPSKQAISKVLLNK